MRILEGEKNVIRLSEPETSMKKREDGTYATGSWKPKTGTGSSIRLASIFIYQSFDTLLEPLTNQLKLVGYYRLVPFIDEN